MIRALMVSTSYPADLRDWRGLFIRHLVFAMARRPDVALSFWAPPGQRPREVEYVASPRESRWLQTLSERGGIAQILRRGPWWHLGAPIHLLRHLHAMYRRVPGISVYHVNWLQNALVLPGTPTPALVSVLGADLRMLRLPGMKSLLRRAFRGRPTMLCPNAEWMVPVLRKAFGKSATIRCLPLGIDPDWFTVERSPPRAEPARWLCVSRITADKIGPLFDWGESFFRGPERELHLFGPRQDDLAIPDWVRWHGPVTADALRNDWFPSASGLLTLSRHSEGLPQVILEAMASGLPVVASPLPAHRDVIDDRDTGWVCRDRAELGEALSALADPALNAEVGRRGRARVAEGFGTWDDCAARYVAAYRELLGTADRG